MSGANFSHLTFLSGALSGVVILTCLIVYETAVHPASVAQGGLAVLILIVGCLLAYGLAALWSRHQQTLPTQSALVTGATAGLLVGLAEMVNISLETSGAVSESVRGLAPPSAMALMATLFGAAGSITYRRTASLSLGVWSGLWCAIVGSLLTCLFGFAYNLSFMASMQEITRAGFLRSGMQDPTAFVVRKSLQDMSSHLVIAPLLAVFFSFSGALMSRYLRDAEQQVKVIVAVLGSLQLTVGIGSIRWALGLARPQRPPFIMFGMLATGIALTYIHPILISLQQRPQAADPALPR